MFVFEKLCALGPALEFVWFRTHVPVVFVYRLQFAVPAAVAKLYRYPTKLVFTVLPFAGEVRVTLRVAFKVVFDAFEAVELSATTKVKLAGAQALFDVFVV